MLPTPGPTSSLADCPIRLQVSLVEVQKEMGAIRKGFTNLEKELQWHKGQKSKLDSDCFPDLAEDFVSEHKPPFEVLTARCTEMVTQFSSTVKRFEAVRVFAPK
jgi:hypothetical protein